MNFLKSLFKKEPAVDPKSEREKSDLITPEVIFGMSMMLKDESQRDGALILLQGIGPAARKLVPAIIETMGVRDPLTRMYCANALEAITGEKLGENPVAWQKWWSEQKPGGE